MDYYFCLVPKEDNTGLNLGRTYVYKNRSKWIQCNEISTYLGAGYVKGADYIVHDGKAYTLLKMYMDVDEGIGVFLAAESVSGCDI